jgi:hypothetical protein
MSRLGATFYAFALILLPVLASWGVVTFLRLVQCWIEDLAYANRISLLRNFYVRVSPELEPYLAALSGTRSAAPVDGEKLAPTPWQLTLTAAGMVAVVNSVVVAACAGLVLKAAGVHSLAIPVAVGAVMALLRSRCTNATTVARATPTARRRSIGPRSSCHYRNGPTRHEGALTNVADITWLSRSLPAALTGAPPAGPAGRRRLRPSTAIDARLCRWRARETTERPHDDRRSRDLSRWATHGRTARARVHG